MNIKVDFDNIVVKEEKNDFNVKVLMLKGEKGDAGEGEDNVIEEVQVNGTALTVTNKAVNVPVPIVDSALSSSSTNTVQNKVINTALSGKVDTSTLNNYYEISEVDSLLNTKANSTALNNYYTKAQTYSQNETNALLNSKANTSAIDTINSTLLAKANTSDIENTYETIANHNSDINALSSQISSLANGSPLVASSVSGMTDTTKVYVNTSDGNWYYYNGSSWVSGGTYQSTGIGESTIGFNELTSDLREHIKINDASYTLTNGYFVQKSGLTNAEHALFSISSPIQLKKGDIICFKGKGYNTNVSMVTVCDENGSNRSQGVFSVDSTTREYEYTATDDCYVILSSQTSELSNVYIVSELITKNEIPKNLYTICSYIDSYNLPEPTTLTDNSYVLLTNGTIGEYNGLKATGFIEVLPLSIKVSSIENLTTSPKNIGICFYDKYKNFISSKEYTREAKETITSVPFNTKYIRYTISQNMTTYGYTMEYVSFKEFLDYINQYVEEMTETKEEKYSSNLFTSFIKFGVIGDSLASGEAVANNGGTTQYIDNYDYSWGQFIARNHGMTCINFSHGGATTRSWLRTDNDWGITKLLQSQNLCNAYIIGLGVNDPGIGSNYLGTINDMHDDYSLNADTFYGNYGKIIGNIKTISPKAKIFIFTVPNDWGEYNTAIRNIANYYDENVYLIDLYNLFHNDYYGNDTFITNNRRVGHYNAIAYNYMSELLFMELSKYMYNNYEEFKQIEFINTNYSYTE